MNRKHNPLVSLAALVLLATILVWICAGCGVKAEAASNTSDRLTFEEAGRNHILVAYIITDTQTGTEYLLVDLPNGGAMTVLQPGEG